MKPLTIGYSPCPNDTFIFFAMSQKLISNLPPCQEILKDIESLNNMAFEHNLDLTKISFHALGHLRDSYALLDAGGALGRGCGPIVVSKEPLTTNGLAGKKIALPGRFTTAALLLRLFNPNLEQLVYLPFNEILPACNEGIVDAGVIIHESRFTFQGYGLIKIIDLGEWWENETGLPIPLGGILAKRNLGKRYHAQLNKLIQNSIEYAYAHPAEVRPYIKRYAQEMDEAVMYQHINLYVNEYSIQYGEEGKRAINELISRAEMTGIIPKSEQPLFL